MSYFQYTKKLSHSTFSERRLVSPSFFAGVALSGVVAVVSGGFSIFTESRRFELVLCEANPSCNSCIIILHYCNHAVVHTCPVDSVSLCLSAIIIIIVLLRL